MDPIVPRGEAKGELKPISIAFPREMLARVDRIKKATNNRSRSAVIKHLLRWALDAYDKLREDERDEMAPPSDAHDDAA